MGKKAIDINGMAKEIVSWRIRYNDAMKELSDITNDERFRVETGTIESVVSEYTIEKEGN